MTAKYEIMPLSTEAQRLLAQPALVAYPDLHETWLRRDVRYRDIQCGLFDAFMGNYRADGGNRPSSGFDRDPQEMYEQALEQLLLFFKLTSDQKRLPNRGICMMPSKTVDQLWHAWLERYPDNYRAFCERHFGIVPCHIENNPGMTIRDRDVGLMRTWFGMQRLYGQSVNLNRPPKIFAFDKHARLPGGCDCQLLGRRVLSPPRKSPRFKGTGCFWEFVICVGDHTPRIARLRASPRKAATAPEHHAAATVAVDAEGDHASFGASSQQPGAILAIDSGEKGMVSPLGNDTTLDARAEATLLTSDDHAHQVGFLHPIRIPVVSIIVVAEKPSIARIIAPFARRHWPQEIITVLSAIPYGNNYWMEYPQGLSWSDYPRLVPPVIRVEEMGSCWQPRLVDGAGNLHPCNPAPGFFERATAIVQACDPDHTGAMAFALLVESIFGADVLRQRSFPALQIMALDDASITKAFARMEGFAIAWSDLLVYGRVKRYFDYNWNLNALVILEATARAAGLPVGAPPLSKYSVLLLWWLSQQDSAMSEGEVISMMGRWKGTGQHSEVGEMGSCASRSTIQSHLVANGLIEDVALPGSKKRVLQVTSLGHRYLELLHEEFCDLDLPFRLDEWCRQGLDKAQPEIDLYIRTAFAKQQRFIDGQRRS